MVTTIIDDPQPYVPGLGDQMELIREVLEKAREFNLEPEVVTWALKAMQEDPELEPYEAIVDGYKEWVK
jgi:predicted translin family RNA/ssDNA-binding protein